MPGIEDRLLVERLLNTRLVPYNMDTEERMKKLFLLFTTIDENASKAFIEIQKNQMQVRFKKKLVLHKLQDIFYFYLLQAQLKSVFYYKCNSLYKYYINLLAKDYMNYNYIDISPTRCLMLLAIYTDNIYCPE